MQILHFCFENICLAKYNLGSTVLPVGDHATLFRSKILSFGGE